MWQCMRYEEQIPPTLISIFEAVCLFGYLVFTGVDVTIHFNQ